MIILFQNIRYVKELADLVMAVLGYLQKLKRGLGLAFGEHFLHGFFDKVDKFQCHIFFPSQDTIIKLLSRYYYQDTVIQSLSFYLDS